MIEVCWRKGDDEIAVALDGREELAIPMLIELARRTHPFVAFVPSQRRNEDEEIPAAGAEPFWPPPQAGS